ncbi:MAG: UbiH/UbiF/VisC/COQ6 family ubiquinone biosynthesis hydroxylase [Geminicoccaceae bacterium]
MTRSRRYYDLAVVGGGMTGLVMADAVAGAGADVLLIDPVPWPAAMAPPFDGRVTAIARASRYLLEGIGVWSAMADEATAITDIEVGDEGASSGVHYDHREVGGDSLGHIVENRIIRSSLVARAKELVGETLTLALPDRVTRLDRRSSSAIIDLENGGRVEASLVIGADGRNSICREEADIDVMNWAYRQTGIVATIAHQKLHHGLAVERFFPSGPLAILPMKGKRSSIVWAAENELAAAMIALDDEAFIDELQERFDARLGKIALAGPRFHYPLSMTQATRYTDQRLALVGDAARAIHPIAGQGWNLAVRDVAALAELVIDALRLGIDPGSASILTRYERWRRFDSLALIAITDGLNRLFANDVLPVKIAREWGLSLVQRTPPLKRFFMNHAMGLVGDLPRLMRGEAL